MTKVNSKFVSVRFAGGVTAFLNKSHGFSFLKKFFFLIVEELWLNFEWFYK